MAVPQTADQPNSLSGTHRVPNEILLKAGLRTHEQTDGLVSVTTFPCFRTVDIGDLLAYRCGGSVGIAAYAAHRLPVSSPTPNCAGDTFSRWRSCSGRRSIGQVGYLGGHLPDAGFQFSHPRLAKMNYPFYDYGRAVFKYTVSGIPWDFPVSEIAEFPDSGVLAAGREIKGKDEGVFGNSLGRLVIGGWLAATVWVLPTIPPVSEGVSALSLQSRPLEYILSKADLVVRVKLLTVEPVYYISDNSINWCALEIKATTLETLKGNVKQGETLNFLAGYSGVFFAGLTASALANDFELTNPEMDIFPTELLVFLTSGQEGINASELEQLDRVKSSFRSCLALRYQREGFHTVAFERPGTFDRWAEKQFGGKWVGFEYEFPYQKEEIEIREIQFGPTIHHVYGVINWEDFRKYLLRLIREQGE